MKLNCNCGNILLDWQLEQQPNLLVPRYCQCQYCLSHDAAYVSVADSIIDIKVQDKQKIKLIQHGTRSALFHHCIPCNQPVFVTSEIAQQTYAVINAKAVDLSCQWQQAIMISFTGEDLAQRLKRRQKNWINTVKVS